MVSPLSSIETIAAQFDLIVLDQWGVLHNGSQAYPGAVAQLQRLNQAGVDLAVLSNSGKRAQANTERLAEFGYPSELFSAVMTSGEAFWQYWSSGNRRQRPLYPITAKPGDAQAWAGTLDCQWQPDIEQAQAVLLMGLPEGENVDRQRAALQRARERRLPLYCTNPDQVSPRAGGRLQIAPGSLALEYQQQGGEVQFYGKPYPAVFQALSQRFDLSPERILMVGDSLAHDIHGAQQAGWRSLLIQGGLYQQAFAHSDKPSQTLIQLAAKHQVALPDYTLFYLSGEPYVCPAL